MLAVMPNARSRNKFVILHIERVLGHVILIVRTGGCILNRGNERIENEIRLNNITCIYFLARAGYPTAECHAVSNRIYRIFRLKSRTGLYRFFAQLHTILVIILDFYVRNKLASFNLEIGAILAAINNQRISLFVIIHPSSATTIVIATCRRNIDISIYVRFVYKAVLIDILRAANIGTIGSCILTSAQSDANRTIYCKTESSPAPAVLITMILCTMLGITNLRYSFRQCKRICIHVNLKVGKRTSNRFLKLHLAQYTFRRRIAADIHASYR